MGAGGRLRYMQTAGIPLCTGDDEFLSFRQDHQWEMLQLNIESNRKLGENLEVGLLCVQGRKSVQFPYTLPSPPLTHTSSPDSHLFPSLTPSSTPSQAAPRGNYFELASPSTPVHFNRVSCLGNESSLLRCDRRIVKEKNRSNHTADAGVICTGGPY